MNVINKGIGGQDAAEEVLRMKDDVTGHKAQIVIWQVGTNSAIRRDPLTKFAGKLRAGIDIGRALGPELVLMNLQYVPAVVALPDEEEYARAMAEVAKEKGDTWLAENLVGTGPYKFVEWKRDQYIMTERNDEYWGPKAAFKQFKYVTIPEATTQIAELLRLHLEGDVN